MSDFERRPSISQRRIRAVAGSPQDVSAAMVIYQLYDLLRESLHYAPGHPQVSRQAERFVQAVLPQFSILEVDHIEIALTGTEIVVSGRTLKRTAAEYARAVWLVDKLAAHGVSGLRIGAALNVTTVSEFARRFAAAESTGLRLPEGPPLEHFRVIRARLSPEWEQRLMLLGSLSRLPHLQLYAEGLSRAGAWIAERQKEGAAYERIAVKRYGARWVDALLTDPSAAIGLGTVWPDAPSPERARLDATLISTALALHLGLSAVEALDFFVTALIRPLPPAETTWWNRPPLTGKGAARVALESMRALESVMIFESLATRDMELPPEWYGTALPKHVATLTLDVGEAFADLQRSGGPGPALSADLAMTVLLAHAGQHLEPHLVGALLSLVGYYPPGTVVRLNSGDQAVVVEAPTPGNDPARPLVRLLQPLRREVYDLSEARLADYAIVGSVKRAAGDEALVGLLL